MVADVLILVAAGALLAAGFVGTVLPVLPGPPLAWCGLLLAYFSARAQLPLEALIAAGIAAVLVTVADNVFPALLTKRGGGSAAASRGAVAGLIVGLFAGPPGVILGPFAGAFIGELLHDSSDVRRALRAAFGAFKGFLLGTGMKMITVAAFIWLFVWALVR